MELCRLIRVWPPSLLLSVMITGCSKEVDFVPLYDVPNGDLKSLMNENDLSVYSSCIYPIDNGPCDDSFKRSYYLDELFEEETPVPDWGN